MTDVTVDQVGDFEAAAQRASARRRRRAVLAYVVLGLFLLGAIAPFVYLISPAFRDEVELFSWPPQWFFGNFEFLFERTSFWRWALNTFIFATGTTLIHLVIASMAGFAFAKMRFPGRQVLFFLVLATLMVPLAALLAPLYLIVKELGMLNTYWGLILPLAVSPLGVFMMRQFIATLPEGIYEAARLDGASEWQVFRRVVIPLIKPALVVLGIFTFMTAWTAFLWPLVATTNDEMRTLTVGVGTLEGQFVTNWGVIAAGSLMTMVPITIVFLIFQRWFVRASLAGALKG